MLAADAGGTCGGLARQWQYFFEGEQLPADRPGSRRLTFENHGLEMVV